jgi:hypothetical protein
MKEVVFVNGADDESLDRDFINVYCADPITEIDSLNREAILDFPGNLKDVRYKLYTEIDTSKNPPENLYLWIYDKDQDYSFRLRGPFASERCDDSLILEKAALQETTSNRLREYTQLDFKDRLIRSWRKVFGFKAYESNRSLSHYLGIPKYKNDKSRYRLEWASYLLGGFVIEPVKNLLKLPLEMFPRFVTDMRAALWNAPYTDTILGSRNLKDLVGGIGLFVLGPLSLALYPIRLISRAVLSPVQSYNSANSIKNPLIRVAAKSLSVITSVASLAAVAVFAPIALAKAGVSAIATTSAHVPTFLKSAFTGVGSLLKTGAYAISQSLSAVAMAATLAVRSLPFLRRPRTSPTISSESEPTPTVIEPTPTVIVPTPIITEPEPSANNNVSHSLYEDEDISSEDGGDNLYEDEYISSEDGSDNLYEDEYISSEDGSDNLYEDEYISSEGGSDNLYEDDYFSSEDEPIASESEVLSQDDSGRSSGVTSRPSANDLVSQSIFQQGNSADATSSVPVFFKCRNSDRLMVDPVIDADGVSWDRQEYIAQVTEYNRNELGNDEISQLIALSIRPNRLLKDLIDAYNHNKHAINKDSFTCPLSLNPMTDPVVAADGFTYEKEYVDSALNHQLEAEIREGGSFTYRSPSSNQAISDGEVWPNLAVKDAGEWFRAQYVPPTAQTRELVYEGPEFLSSSLTGEVMTDPMIDKNGNSYDKSDIGERCSSSGEIIKLEELRVNVTLQKIIRAWEENDMSLVGLDCELFACPYCFETLEDPVVTLGGQSCERASIEEWVDKEGTDPITDETLSRDDLWPNYPLKEVVSQFNTSSDAASSAPRRAMG